MIGKAGNALCYGQGKLCLRVPGALPLKIVHLRLDGHLCHLGMWALVYSPTPAEACTRETLMTCRLFCISVL